MIGLAEIVPDTNFPSTIGNAHGDIYEAQFEHAKVSHKNDARIVVPPHETDCVRVVGG